MDDLVFSVDAVGGFGEEFARGLLTEDVFLLSAVGDLVGRVGLTEAELGGGGVSEGGEVSDGWS
jgi:hypothetical protein